VGSNLIKRIGGKKTLPSILFLFLSISLFAQYPNTGNKQRLGYQTTGDGLVYRGRASDTVAIKSSGLNNAYFILDTVNNILYNYIKTKGGWKFSNGDTVITGTGTTNYLPKFTGTSTLGNSIIYDSGTNIGIGLTTANSKLTLYEGDFKLFKNHIFEDTATWYSNILFTDELDRLGAKIVGERTTWDGANMGLGFETGNLGVVTRRMTITSNGNIGIGTKTPNANFDVRGSVIINEDSGDFDTRIESDGNANMLFVDASTDRVGIGTNTPSNTLDVNGEVKIATVTATPTSLLGKDASNVVGEVTTVAQTGLMTRGETTETTGNISAVFNVTHGLGSNPTSVIVTGTGASGSEKLIYEVYAKNSTTFSVQVWNYDGTEAASTSVTIYWLAIK
jgi:hypothetical protein